MHKFDSPKEIAFMTSLLPTKTTVNTKKIMRPIEESADDDSSDLRNHVNMMKKVYKQVHRHLKVWKLDNQQKTFISRKILKRKLVR